MKLSEFKNILRQHPDKQLQFILPTGTKIPVHAHITDVARVDKRFIDCGGTMRTESLCRLQTWFADDTEHRITAGTLFKILEKAVPILGTEDLDLDVEHEAPFISQFPVAGFEVSGPALRFRLDIRHTTCLAQDACQPSASKAAQPNYQGIPSLAPAKCCG